MGAFDDPVAHGARSPHDAGAASAFHRQRLLAQSGNGYEGEVGASRAARAERDRDASVAAIGDGRVRDIQVIGSLDEAREKLQERAKLGADVQMRYMPPGDVGEVGKTLEALAP